VKRGAAASFALAAAGMLYSRLGVRRRRPGPAEGPREGSSEELSAAPEALSAAPEELEGAGEQPASSVELDRARFELAEQLRRRASQPPADA